MTRIQAVCAAAIGALLLPALARAQTVIVPMRVHGCGTVTATTSSSTISAANITLCPGSPAFPTSGTLSVPLKIKVQSSATQGVYVCKFGGTCTTAGELMAIGESVTSGLENINIGTAPPSVLSVSGSQPVFIEW